MNCHREVGFLPDRICISSLDPAQDGLYAATAKEAQGQLYKKCQNYDQAGICNWMIPADKAEPFCVSCRLDVIIPNLRAPENIDLWACTEAAKRRLIYSYLRLKLPLDNRDDDPQRGLGFRFLSDTPNPDGTVNHIMTEHNQGLITLNIIEADDAAREKIRMGMKEPYRTLLGHFRHETGHYYWDRLVLTSRFLEPYRELFGDERKSYDGALQTYYAQGAPPNWQDNYISPYATMHPWEDWAETWAHYLHIQDALEVAADFGLVGKQMRIDPMAEGSPTDESLKASPFNQVLEAWSDLTVALNSINRSMGHHDLYPFVLSKPVANKLYFISQVIAESHEEAPLAS